MFLFFKLSKLIGPLVNAENRNLIAQAYLDAAVSHLGQRLESMEHYIVYPLNIACLAAELHSDYEVICASLLSCIVIDQSVTLYILEKNYGEVITKLVRGCIQVNAIDFQHMKDMDYLIHMLLSVLKDVRVFIIIMVESLHNLRHIKFASHSIAKQYAQKSLLFYSKLAYRMGAQRIKEEIEDHAFRILYPVRYKSIEKALLDYNKSNYDHYIAILNLINKYLKPFCSKLETNGRIKKPYSIYQKMKSSLQTFAQILDIYAFTICLDTVEQCYLILGKLHSLFTPLYKHFKDYIGSPKDNGYQAIHTTVVGPYKTVIEIQIKTHDMHKSASMGINAHIFYKDNNPSKNSQEISYFLRGIEQIQSILESNSREEINHGKIYALTPKHQIIPLPVGATGLDFAYAVHSELGRRAFSIIIANRHYNLDYIIKSGEVIQVETFNRVNISKSWLLFVKTTKAMRDIKKYLMNQTKTLEPISYQSNQPLKSFVCTLCMPLYDEKSYLDSRNIIHVEGCEMLNSVNDLFTWPLSYEQDRYVTTLYLHFQVLEHSNGRLNQFIIKTLVKHEANIINFIIEMSYIKLIIDVQNFRKLNLIKEELESTQYFRAITRTAKQ